jgi:hypothetical protein
VFTVEYYPPTLKSDSFAMPLMALLRVAAGRRFSEKVQAASLLTILCGVAAHGFFYRPNVQAGQATWPDEL